MIKDGIMIQKIRGMLKCFFLIMIGLSVASQNAVPKRSLKDSPSDEQELLTLLGVSSMAEGTEVIKKLLDKFEVKTVPEAIQEIDDLQEELDLHEDDFQEILDEFSKSIGTIYRTAANALNNESLKEGVEYYLKKSPIDIIDPKNLHALNVVLYDTIFELKKMYFDATYILPWAEGLIKNLQKAVNMKKNGKSGLRIKKALPKNIPAMPNVKDLNKQTLINDIQKLSVKTPANTPMPWKKTPAN